MEEYDFASYRRSDKDVLGAWVLWVVLFAGMFVAWMASGGAGHRENVSAIAAENTPSRSGSRSCNPYCEVLVQAGRISAGAGLPASHVRQ